MTDATGPMCGPDPPSVGLWLDDPPSTALHEPYWAQLMLVGVQSIAIMLDTSRKGWDPKWTGKQLTKFGRLANERNIELVLTTWPDPVRRSINRMAKDMRRYIGITGAVAWEVDTESNWHPRRVRGFRKSGDKQPIDVASEYLAAQMREVKAVTDCRLELTTFTSHTENGRAANLAPHMDRLLPQAYSVRHREKRNPKTGRYDVPWNVPWAHTYGPGTMQHHTLDRTAMVPGVEEGSIELACGLAGYDQKWPDHDALDAMQMAYDAAVTHGVKEVRYWSSKWAVGIKSNRTPYAGQFLQQLLQARRT